MQISRQSGEYAIFNKIFQGILMQVAFQSMLKGALYLNMQKISSKPQKG